MNKDNIIGEYIYHRSTGRTGVVVSFENNLIGIDFGEGIEKYSFPSAFNSVLEIDNYYLQQKFEGDSKETDFHTFQCKQIAAIDHEIQYIKQHKTIIYKLINGICVFKQLDRFVYVFDTDDELHFPDDTSINIIIGRNKYSGTVIHCEDFSVTIGLSVFLGKTCDSLDFTADQWRLLEALAERIKEISAEKNGIAYQLACKCKAYDHKLEKVRLGQNTAIQSAEKNNISFIWGPPGTGKTETLAKIATDRIREGKRVLMLSYSNVSVDEALLRVASMDNFKAGTVIRYGYVRNNDLIGDPVHTSYGYVLSQNQELQEEVATLNERKKSLKRKKDKQSQEELVRINKSLNKIRKKLSDKEKEVVENALFIATTVSKAVIDKTIRSQTFDTVIFDEASMAYVPQVIYAASLASDHFVCLGDFKQLPSIVQDRENDILNMDIYDYTGISEAIESGSTHPWLVMLDIQRRMHKTISDFLSQNMYEGLLKTDDAVYQSRQAVADIEPVRGEALSMIDISDTYSVCIKTYDGSKVNILSAMLSAAVAETISHKYRIGIITPYRAQSRLILAMVRDMDNKSEQSHNISCATVHQFQGSEKPVIIYDAVECYREKYIGGLLGDNRNNTANRLFNVAVSRAQGKFIMIGNRAFFQRKRISKKLLFYKIMEKMRKEKLIISGEDISLEMKNSDIRSNFIIGDIEETWEQYLISIRAARKNISITIPGLIDDDEDMLKSLLSIIEEKSENGVEINIHIQEGISIPKSLKRYGNEERYVTVPVTIIDNEIVWYGQPLCVADFISEGEPIPIEYSMAIRFEGKNTARLISNALGI